jgi:SAM-dependent methyltransferase
MSHPDDFQTLELLIRGFQISRMLRLVADLELADKLPEEATWHVEEIAAACHVQTEPLLRVLRALAAFGVFCVTAEGQVSHTSTSRLLRSDAPKSLHVAARFWSAPGSWKAWGELDTALSGSVPHEVAWQTSRFDYLRQHPEEARLFDAFMAAMPDNRHEVIASTYDFSKASLIADVGGGNGETLRRILKRFPQARGLLIDRDDVVNAIPGTARMDGRIEVQAGDFLHGVPDGADLYLLVRVLHDWPDEDCVRILKNCRAAMPTNARLLIVEQLLEPDPQLGRPSMYLLDVQMMAMFGRARERTHEEFKRLLLASGLDLVRQLPTESVVSIIEAAPVP